MLFFYSGEVEVGNDLPNKKFFGIWEMNYHSNVYPQLVMEEILKSKKKEYNTENIVLISFNKL